jgi:EAL domain-containing protein (putative c-di-GMP-specific phosphodiesterase class I)
MLHGKAWVGLVSERRADGSLLRVELSLSPIRDAAGNIVGTVEIGRDRTREAEFEAERDRATRLRAAFDQALHDQPPGASLEVAAQVLCDRLAVLPEIDFVSVFAFGTPGEIQSVAHRAPPGFPPEHSGSSMRAARMHERASDGPWAGAWVPSVHDGTWARALSDLGARAAGNWPVTHGDHVGGVLMIVTSDADFAASLLGDGAARFDLGGTASALLGERMHARRTERGLRDALEATLNARAFHPVFQPIVELETGETMGYEALTRFDSGQRPDLCFADAWSVGLGLELELATLEAAVAAAKELPPGTWLDLNASPRLLADSGRLREILWSADRPLVLEVTEHERIEDYDALRAAVRELGDDLRVAVDDAGAGIANFGHIIDLRPDFVKLDISLVRQVNANLGRQAMVVGMRHFSRTAGCRLIAEGVETEDEARTLTALGVEFGQGYHFGHPGAADVWTAAGDSQGRREHAMLPPDPPRKDVP